MRAEALAFLCCPLCGGEFSSDGRTLRCAAQHSFDLARQGYVDLRPGSPSKHQADTGAMVAAREAFLAAGHFAGLRVAVAEAAARALCAAAASAPPLSAPTPRGCLVEVGAGTAYYLAGVLDRLPDRIGLALDLSKHAARRTARAHPRLAAAVVCDVWQGIPLRSGCADLILDVFAPRNAREFRRILAPTGRLLVVSPTVRHLQPLVESLGLLAVDPHKNTRLKETLGEAFVTVSAEVYEEEILLTSDEIALLVTMGPSARHLPTEELKRRLASLSIPRRSSSVSGPPTAAPIPPGTGFVCPDTLSGPTGTRPGPLAGGTVSDQLPRSESCRSEPCRLPVTVSVHLTAYRPAISNGRL